MKEMQDLAQWAAGYGTDGRIRLNVNQFEGPTSRTMNMYAASRGQTNKRGCRSSRKTPEQERRELVDNSLQ
jgi:hypothetical protein